MRSALAVAAIVALIAGPSFAQSGSQAPTQRLPAQSASTNASKATNVPKKAEALTQKQAMTQIEAQGYTKVSNLKKDAKGMWNATAMKDGKRVQLSLDTQGHVAQID
jgi:predicted aspartyl protease